MADEEVGCGRPTGAVVGEKPPKEGADDVSQTAVEEASMVQVKVGGKAPDFEAPAYHRGKFFSVKLSDYKGKWVLVCFYPGDFTFV